MGFIRNKENEKKDLMKIANMSANCIANMGRSEYIFLRNIDKICYSLNCTPNEVIDFRPDKNEGAYDGMT